MCLVPQGGRERSDSQPDSLAERLVNLRRGRPLERGQDMAVRVEGQTHL
jgi:hypothetical protein